MNINQDAQQFVGCGIMILLILAGMGGCACLFSYSERMDAETKVIKQSTKQ